MENRTETTILCRVVYIYIDIYIMGSLAWLMFCCNAVAASLLFGWEVLARSKQPSLDAKEENVDQVHSADVMGCNICMRLGHWDEGAHGRTEEQTRIFPGSLHNTKGHELRQEAPTHKDTSNPRAALLWMRRLVL